MRTTVTIDDHLLAEAKLIAARQHRTIGSVLEEALRALIAQEAEAPTSDEPFRLPRFNYPPNVGGPRIDLYDRDHIEELLGEGGDRAVL